MKRTFLDLSDDDIKKNAYMYDEEQLIYTLETSLPSLRRINRFQKISAYIAAKYVIFGGIDEDNGDCVEDRYLDTNDILRHQKHITEDEIDEAFTFLYAEKNKQAMEREEMAKNDYSSSFKCLK